MAELGTTAPTSAVGNVVPQSASTSTHNNSLTGDGTAPAKIGEFLLNWRNQFFIATDGEKDPENYEKAQWAQLAKGINNVTPTDNPTTANDEYYDGEGFGTSDVTSKRIQFVLAGHRVYGDPAQDYVMKHFLDIGDDLKTLFKYVDAQGNTVVGRITMTNMTPFGGQPGAKQTFNVTLVFNGKPKYIPASTHQ
ncbi:phage tail tube protein [Limosilactobacillus reuteri]|uniref:phage tail tube protein n=1 Tax=Limosilactobacillus reuteri TaxID=1598 RepID=UPI001CDBB98B|nr:capsid protein [Limosilactobacillus reuteri]MCH5385320.1 capsid protein [Limosilactobacillus reuteri]